MDSRGAVGGLRSDLARAGIMLQHADLCEIVAQATESVDPDLENFHHRVYGGMDVSRLIAQLNKDNLAKLSKAVSSFSYRFWSELRSNGLLIPEKGCAAVGFKELIGNDVVFYLFDKDDL